MRGGARGCGHARARRGAEWWKKNRVSIWWLSGLLIELLVDYSSFAENLPEDV
jgi:hypothetical protein